ncbi:Hsp70 family protein [[Mycobacterium] kokjensenii]|uniref:Hsp70 family protein n=1 Tax=[Mycobacterium] kokjensenii TaxID=3064287 RepID=A0ABN9MXC2_9MYCO|nr:Hsp70 family protein [Mycolicibacter sp. MU0083]CAJ1496625.1 Hsp70 family protein [Mycolicibacter sp. MU0083]
MAQETGPALGMSVGATTLAAVTADRAVTRRPVLTLFRDRPSQIGMPSENSAVSGSLHDRGLVVTDFVDRVGGGGPVVASDGSTHRAEQLLADGLHALAYAVTEGQPIPPAVAVTHPAHWSRDAVAALRTALGRVAEWAQHPVTLIPDTTAVLAALQANPGLPDQGVIAVCDFGGSGTNVTLVDAGREFAPLGATRRITTFAGDVIDQALLDHVVADLGGNGEDSPTVGSLNRLRNQCRDAKEQLSAETVAELAGFHGGAWLTRVELDEALRQPLDGFFTVLEQILADNDVRPDGLSAIVSVGGGANMPTVTTGLSQRFGVAVVSSPRPQLTAAIGAALSVAGSAVAVPKQAPPPSESPQFPVPEPPPEFSPPQTGNGGTEPAPQPLVTPPDPVIAPPAKAVVPEREPLGGGGVPWYRRPIPVVILAAVVATLLGTVAVLVLRNAAEPAPDSTVPPVPVTSTPSPTYEPPPAFAPSPEPVLPMLPDESVVPEFPEGPENPEIPEHPAPEPTEPTGGPGSP